MNPEKSSESLVSLIKRAEKRVGRSFREMTKKYVASSILLKDGMRVQSDERFDEVEVWILVFGSVWEIPTLVYGRTIPHAFQRAIYPEGRKKLRGKGGRSI